MNNFTSLSETRSPVKRGAPPSKKQSETTCCVQLENKWQKRQRERGGERKRGKARALGVWWLTCLWQKQQHWPGDLEMFLVKETAFLRAPTMLPKSISSRPYLYYKQTAVTSAHRNSQWHPSLSSPDWWTPLPMTGDRTAFLPGTRERGFAAVRPGVTV